MSRPKDIVDAGHNYVTQLAAQVSDRSQGSTMQALSHIRQIDYTVIFARDMDAMRHFYETLMEFRCCVR